MWIDRKEPHSNVPEMSSAMKQPRLAGAELELALPVVK